MGRIPAQPPTDEGRLSRRRFLAGTGAGLAVASTIGCGLSRPSPPTAQPTVTARPPSPTVATTMSPLPTQSARVTPTAGSTAVTPTVESTATPSPVPSTVTWWTGPTDAAWLAGTNDVGDMFTRYNPSVTVKISGGHVDFGRIVGGIASGQSPDLLDVGAMIPFAARGMIASLQTRLDASSIKTSNFHSSMLANGSWRGQLYGMPALDHGPELGLIWNKALANGVLPTADTGPTLPDMYRLGKNLTKYAAGGSIDLLGFDPLDGVGSLLDTARDLTGQDWIDPTSRRITLTNSAYADYLSAVVAYYHDLGADKLSKFRQDVPPLTDSRDSGENRGRQVAILSGYWSVSDVATLSQDPSWTFGASWAPTGPTVGRIQRVGGRLLVVPIGTRQPGMGWELLQFLVGDPANGAFFARTGRFVATQSFLSSGIWKRQAALQFFVDSLSTATRVTARDASPVASFAQVKWEQAINDVVSGNRPVPDALAAAQKAVEVEYGLIGG